MKTALYILPEVSSLQRGTFFFAVTPVINDEKLMYVFCFPPGLTTPQWHHILFTTLVKKEL